MSRTGATSSAGLPSFSRAFSPPLLGAVLADTSVGSISERRDAALGLATSFDQIAGIIPLDYREKLRPLLRAIHNDAERRVEVTQQLKKLQQHKANETSPPGLAGVKVPAFQVSRAFIEATPTYSTPTELESARDVFVRTCLDRMIDGKKAEAEWLEKKLDASVLVNTLGNAVLEHYGTVIGPRSKVPKWADVFKPDTNRIECTIDHFEDSPVALEARNKVIHGLPRLIFVTVQLVTNRALVAEQKEAAKRSLKDNVDVEMGDGTQDESVENLRKQLAELRTSFQTLAKGQRASANSAKAKKGKGKETSHAAGGSTGKVASSSKAKAKPKAKDATKKKTLSAKAQGKKRAA